MPSALVATGSYSARENIFDLMVVTDLDSYRLDVRAATLSTGAGTRAVEGEEANCSRIVSDFVDAVRERRSPQVSGRSVLPALGILEHAQRAWDAEHGARSIPGRPLPAFEVATAARAPSRRRASGCRRSSCRCRARRTSRSPST